MLIAIDGPAGAGKSTVARALARRLGFTYLDSGAMYRCVGLLASEAPEDDPSALAAAARIELGERVLLDGRDVTEAIRAPAVSEAASRVAADPGVREALVAKQRALIAAGDWVAEGRDIGTVVAPDAELKVFLTADPAERARRRAAELGGDQAVVMAEQALRDERDSTRAHSPLQPAPGAVVLDTTGLSVEQVVERIADLAWERSTHRPRVLGALAALYALVGGLVFVALLLAGPLWSAFAAGVAVTLALALVTGLRSNFPGALGITLGYSFAFALFIWPVLWLFVGGALWGKWQ